jgi:hypothetical protein
MEDENEHFQTRIEGNTRATEDANGESLELLDKLDAVRISCPSKGYVLNSLSIRFMKNGRNFPQTRLESGRFNQQSL